MKRFYKIIDKINISLFVFLFIFSFSYFLPKNIVISKKIYLDKNSFISQMSEAAVQDMKETGVFASVTIGQAAVESGWGKDEISTTYNNYFGMKAGGDIYVNGIKTKCNSSNRKVIGKSNNQNSFWGGYAVCLSASEGGGSWFRVYDSVLNSIKDHSRNFWCNTSGRYIKNGVFASPNPEVQLYTIAKSGYAVDGSGNITTIGGLRYDQHIYQKIIIPNNLTKYDNVYQSGVKPAYAETCTDAVYTGSTPTIDTSSSSNLNGVSDFKTTYTGDVKEGYIYKTQKNNALKVTKKTVVEKIDENINSIIKSIFTTTGKYSDGKIGASAYTANVTYVNGSFKNKIAYYNQNEYKSYPYGNYGTIASHGCGTTSMAIVISSFLGREVSPVETTNWACSNGYCTSSGSSHSVIPGLAAQYGLNSTNEISSSSNLQPVVDALASGNSLVVVLAKSGEFTNSGHFLVLTGVDASGNISVADPASRKKTEKTYTLDFLINPTQGHIVKFWIISG